MYKIIGADQKDRPVSAEQLRQWISEGRVNAQTKIAIGGTTDWKALGEFPEFAGAQAAAFPAAGVAPGLRLTAVCRRTFSRAITISTSAAASVGAGIC